MNIVILLKNLMKKKKQIENNENEFLNKKRNYKEQKISFNEMLNNFELPQYFDYFYIN